MGASFSDAYGYVRTPRAVPAMCEFDRKVGRRFFGELLPKSLPGRGGIVRVPIHSLQRGLLGAKISHEQRKTTRQGDGLLFIAVFDALQQCRNQIPNRSTDPQGQKIFSLFPL